MKAAAIREYIALHAATPEGVSANDLTKMGGNNGIIYVAIKAQGLTAGRRWRACRWFLDPEHAAAYVRNDAETETAVQAVFGKQTRARWAADAPAIITAATKVTIAPPMADCFRSNMWSAY